MCSFLGANACLSTVPLCWDMYKKVHQASLHRFRRMSIWDELPNVLPCSFFRNLTLTGPWPQRESPWKNGSNSCQWEKMNGSFFWWKLPASVEWGSNIIVYVCLFQNTASKIFQTGNNYIFESFWYQNTTTAFESERDGGWHSSGGWHLQLRQSFRDKNPKYIG